MATQTKRVTQIEYYYHDEPDKILEADCAIGYDGCDEWNGLLDDGILFYFRDQAEFDFAVSSGDCCFEICVVREVI